jgi:hypothetical protein
MFDCRPKKPGFVLQPWRLPRIELLELLALWPRGPFANLSDVLYGYLVEMTYLSKGSPFRPLFVHVHVPKCGGTSLNTLLNAWFNGRMQWIYFPDPKRVLTQNEMEDFVRQNQDVDCISSHHLRLFPPVIGGRPALYLTFLRQPADYCISSARHVVQTQREMSAEQRALQPKNLESLSVVGLIQHWIAEEEKDIFVGADFSRMFFEATAIRLGIDRHKIIRSKEEQESIQNLTRSIAITQLEHFFFVGDFANFSNEIQRLAALLQQLGIETDNMEIPWERRSSDQPFSSPEQEREIRETLTRLLPVDRDVYTHFHRLQR